MAEPTRPQPADSGCELAPVTNWPLIIGAASVAVLGVTIASALLLSDVVWPSVVPVAAAPAPKATPAPEPAGPVVDRAAAVEPAPVRHIPERVVTVKRVVVREYYPMPGRSRVEQE